MHLHIPAWDLATPPEQHIPPIAAAHLYKNPSILDYWPSQLRIEEYVVVGRYRNFHASPALPKLLFPRDAPNVVQRRVGPMPFLRLSSTVLWLARVQVRVPRLVML